MVRIARVVLGILLSGAFFGAGSIAVANDSERATAGIIVNLSLLNIDRKELCLLRLLYDLTIDQLARNLPHRRLVMIEEALLFLKFGTFVLSLVDLCLKC